MQDPGYTAATSRLTSTGRTKNLLGLLLASIRACHGLSAGLFCWRLVARSVSFCDKRKRFRLFHIDYRRSPVPVSADTLPGPARREVFQCMLASRKAAAVDTLLVLFFAPCIRVERSFSRWTLV